MNFNHPGTLMSVAMTKSLKADCAAIPVRAAALEKLVKSVPLTYVSRAIPEVNLDWGGKGTGHEECTRDGEMAYMAAVLFIATKNQIYAAIAVNIIRAWATVNKVWKGNNALLEAAWSCCSLARAAELLKYTMSDADKSKLKWSETESTFNKWIDTTIMPVLTLEDIWRWPVIGNWHFSQICARMQLAILRENRAEFKWCVDRYKLAVEKAFVCSKERCGELSETTRDLTHSAFELGGMTQVAELAFHQSIDLWTIFDGRLFDACELQASLLLKEVPKGFELAEIHTPYGYWCEPVLEIPYAHFNGRKKRPMPKTAALLATQRPERYTFHWGLGTVTHFKP